MTAPAYIDHAGEVPAVSHAALKAQAEALMAAARQAIADNPTAPRMAAETSGFVATCATMFLLEAAGLDAEALTTFASHILAKASYCAAIQGQLGSDLVVDETDAYRRVSASNAAASLMLHVMMAKAAREAAPAGMVLQ